MKLRKYLEENGLKRSFFAKKLGVSLSYLSALIYEKREPSLKVALRIEELTNGQVMVKDLVLPEAASKASPGKRKAKPTASASAEDSI